MKSFALFYVLSNVAGVVLSFFSPDDKITWNVPINFGEYEEHKYNLLWSLFKFRKKIN